MNWWEGVKSVLKVWPRLGDTDPYTRILQLEDRLDEERDARRRAEEKIRALEAQSAQQEEVERDGSVYRRKGQEGEGAFVCSRCHEADRKVVTLQVNTTNGRFFCPNCKNWFQHEYPAGQKKPRRRRHRRSVDEGI